MRGMWRIKPVESQYQAIPCESTHVCEGSIQLFSPGLQWRGTETFNTICPHNIMPSYDLTGPQQTLIKPLFSYKTTGCANLSCRAVDSRGGETVKDDR